MNPTNQNHVGHRQYQRFFIFGFINLKILNANILSTEVKAQTHNETGKAFNSAGNNLSKYYIKNQDILTFYSKLSILGTILLIHP